MITIRQEPFEYRFKQFERGAVDIVLADIPFNNSEIKYSAQEFHVGWDTAFSPEYLIRGAANALRPGGWIDIKTGDRTLGMVRDMLSSDHSTTPHFIRWLYNVGVIGGTAHDAICKNFGRKFTMPQFQYKGTVTWFKKSGPRSIRQTTFRSMCEWIACATRLDEAGMRTAPVAWNWLGQQAMINHLACTAATTERLYWHVKNPFEINGEIHGKIIPCHNKNECDICAQARDEGYEPGVKVDKTPLHLQRRKHPTQTPVYVWDWFLARQSQPGMSFYDPCCGSSGSLIAARKAGLDPIVGSEISWEFTRVSQMRLDGVWKDPVYEQPFETGMLPIGEQDEQ